MRPLQFSDLVTTVNVHRATPYEHALTALPAVDTRSTEVSVVTCTERIPSSNSTPALPGWIEPATE